jgi:hypothetical protein
LRSNDDDDESANSNDDDDNSTAIITATTTKIKRKTMAAATKRCSLKESLLFHTRASSYISPSKVVYSSTYMSRFSWSLRGGGRVAAAMLLPPLLPLSPTLASSLLLRGSWVR